MKPVEVIRRMKSISKAIIEIWKFGGIRTVNISYLSSGQQLKNKTILITGGGSGIGKSIAKACLRQGAQVIIAGRNRQKLERAVKEFKAENLVDVKSIEVDVSDTLHIDEFVYHAMQLCGRDIDVLVNNAGVEPKAFFPNVTECEWNKIYDTNSKGTFFLSQGFCKHWVMNGSTKYCHKIINISSQGGFVGATYPYRMSKWDIVGLTAGLGKLMADHNIIVNGIAPGVIRTEMQHK